MKQRYYLDTSVYGGYFDREFDTHTKRLFSLIDNENITILYSEVIARELMNAPKKIREFVQKLPKATTEFLELENDALQLARLYISKGVVGKTSFDDCLHIALATIYNADILISWNFKHIVNIHRIRGYNSINMRSGYKTLEIRSPKEVVRYGN